MANFDLSKLMEGKNPQAVMLEQTRGLSKKWEQTGLLEGLNEREQSQMSVLLENQAKQLLDEANATSTSSGNEEWNGVNWVEVADMSASGGSGVGGVAADSTSALAFGGYVTGPSASTEEWSGTSNTTKTIDQD